MPYGTKDDLVYEIEILKTIVKTLTINYDEFISSCIDEDSKEIKAPSKKDIIMARSILPKWCKNTLIK